MPARRSTSPLKAGWEKGAFMEIFVRAFADGDGDGVGDLKGLTQRLDELKDLGVTGLWLMPITRNADGDHGYATSDYRSIAPEYGTLADFDELIKQAHARGIGVVMDYVVNHSAAQFPPFMDAAKNPASPWRKWFVFSDTEPKGWDIWGKNPWYLTAAEHWNSKLEPKDLPPAPAGSRDFYFGTFGPHMPDFNLRNPAVVAYHEDSLRFWLNRGLDGFRLDAVPHLIERDAVAWNDQPESRALTLRLAKLIRSYDKRWVVCEATAKPESWAAPNVCGSAFAFGYVENYVKAAKGDTAAVEKLASFWRTAPEGMSTMVHNHDIFAGDRLWDQLQGDEARYKLVAATYLLQPGTPFIYFGEDIGLAGALGVTGDLPLRSPMSWTSDPRTAGFTTGTPFRPLAPNLARQNVASQKADPDSIRSFYKAMLSLRNGHPSIARGSFEHSFAKGNVLGFQRALGKERTLVVINYGASTTVKVPGLSGKAQLVSLFPAVGSAETASKATGSIDLPAQSVQVWRVK
ncbi:MAG: alpha-amylase [Burkholderiales bacterium PBB6]|nr:MAG: alpha-amylase [Burkholderiales bacterium PBB6]